MSAGLYVHVPFCLTRCGYCDFNAYAGLDHLAPSYVDALVAEAELHAADWTAETIDTIYLGGGTPTTLPVASIARLLGRLRSAFDVASEAEVTIEANPDTVDEATFAGFLDAGVTRVSMGVQSFDPAVLASLERVHGPAAARRGQVGVDVELAPTLAPGQRGLELGVELAHGRAVLDHGLADELGLGGALAALQQRAGVDLLDDLHTGRHGLAQPVDIGRRELDRDRPDVLLQVGDAARARDRRDVLTLREDPGEGELGRSAAFVGAYLFQLFDKLQILGKIRTHEPRVHPGWHHPGPGFSPTGKGAS